MYVAAAGSVAIQVRGPQHGCVTGATKLLPVLNPDQRLVTQGCLPGTAQSLDFEPAVTPQMGGHSCQPGHIAAR